jgi:hypothetical protein
MATRILSLVAFSQIAGATRITLFPKLGTSKAFEQTNKNCYELVKPISRSHKEKGMIHL